MKRILLGAAALALHATAASAAPACQTPALLREAEFVRAAVEPVITAGMHDSGAPGVALVFVQGDCTIVSRGYGVADLAAHTPVDPEKTAWPIASISKIFAATLAVQLIGEHRLALDADINPVLKRFKLPPGQPITLRHLLSHTAGLDEIPGRQFDGVAPPDLGAFLGPKLIRYRPPGLRTAYSTYAMAVATAAAEDVTSKPFAQLVHERIFIPAGMTSARVMLRKGDEAGVATPYKLDDGQATPMAYEFYVTPSTSSIVATAADMGRFIRMNLNDGVIDGHRVLPAAPARAMRQQQATINPGVPGWGLGYQLDDTNGLHLAEHGGDIGGFSALLTLIPEKHAGFFIVGHGEGNNLRFKVKGAILDALYPAPAEPVPAPNARDAARFRADYAGKYLSSIACQSCAERDAFFELKVADDGTLDLWGQRWIEVRRDLFVRDDGRAHLGFSRGTDGKVDAVSGGSWRVANRVW